MVLSRTGPRFAVLGGAGAIGRIIVRDLFESSSKYSILIADFDGESARSLARSYRSGRVSYTRADARNPSSLAAVLRGYSVVINCTRHQFNLNVMRAALQARVAYLDLGGLFVWTCRQLRLRRRFAEAGITAVIGMGCAPGLTNVMAAAAATKLERIDSIRIRVGGIDFTQRRGDFVFPYSAQTIIEELTLPAWKWSRGRFVQVKPRSGWERVEFGPPVGAVWAVTTRHSEIATLPIRFKSQGLQFADFKVGFERAFVREIMKRLRAGWTVREFQALPAPREAPNDCEIVRVIVCSVGRKITLDCHARSKPKWRASASDVDTACPASIVAQMLAGGLIHKPGVWAPEDVVPTQSFFDECRRREMTFSEISQLRQSVETADHS
ncbi:MAG: hypothetical protein DMG12_21025 [Acidobacteria bacterium]|nr:MAG: hypothetical protein DMG12_21025 [Acidobacteriota bacterium]